MKMLDEVRLKLKPAVSSSSCFFPKASISKCNIPTTVVPVVVPFLLWVIASRQFVGNFCVGQFDSPSIAQLKKEKKKNKEFRSQMKFIFYVWVGLGRISMILDTNQTFDTPKNNN